MGCNFAGESGTNTAPVARDPRLLPPGALSAGSHSPGVRFRGALHHRSWNRNAGPGGDPKRCTSVISGALHSLAVCPWGGAWSVLPVPYAERSPAVLRSGLRVCGSWSPSEGTGPCPAGGWGCGRHCLIPWLGWFSRACSLYLSGPSPRQRPYPEALGGWAGVGSGTAVAAGVRSIG